MEPLEKKTSGSPGPDEKSNSLVMGQFEAFDELETRRILRKIDSHIMPLMVVSYMLQFLDKTALAYTAILGIIADTHLIGQDFSWASSAFYFGYLIASYPGSIGFVKLPIGKYLAVSVLLWSTVLACHGAASSFRTLTALRVLLGICESVVSPGFSLVTGMWYTPAEHASRHAAWFLGNSIASFFGGLLAFGIGQIHGSIEPWRWLFIIFGLVSFVWGIILLVFLPDSPQTARFLTEPERAFVVTRVQREQKSAKDSKWKAYQAIEAVKDPKTWFLVSFITVTSIPNGGVTTFSSVIIKGLGFTTIQTQLMGMPVGFVNIVFVIISAWTASKFPNARCYTIIGLNCISILGTALLRGLPTSNVAGRLSGVFILIAFAGCFPIMLSLVASNVTGFSKKSTVGALLFIGYCAGNIAGPQIFRSQEAPRYNTGTTGMLACFCIGALIILILRFYLSWENSRRDREQGIVNSMDRPIDLSTDRLIDETDWENRNLRYFL